MLLNQCRSLASAQDQPFTGRRFRVLNIVDDVTSECIGTVVDRSILGRRVVLGLADPIIERGRPMMISVITPPNRLERGAAWSGDAGTEWHHIMPGKPTRHRFVGSFNGHRRNELLFFTIGQAGPIPAR